MCRRGSFLFHIAISVHDEVMDNECIHEVNQGDLLDDKMKEDDSCVY